MAKPKQPYANRRTLWNILPADVRQQLLDIHQDERKGVSNEQEPKR